jgi:hypothetical protein
MTSACSNAFGAPGKDLVCRFFCFPAGFEDAAPAAQRMLVAYAAVPVYAAFFRRLAWGEPIDPMVSAWEAGDRKRAVERCGFVEASARGRRPRCGPMRATSSPMVGLNVGEMLSSKPAGASGGRATPDRDA